MSEATNDATAAGSGDVDELEAALEAMRVADQEDTSDTSPASEPDSDPAKAEEDDAAAKADDEGQDEPEGKKQDPLSAEEANKRWKQTRAAMREERAKRQSTEAELAELRAEIARLRGTSDPQEQDLNDPEDIPDPAKDPEGAFRAAIDYARRMREEQKRAEQERAQEAQRSEAIRTIMSQANEAERDYMQSVPEYPEAAKFLRDNRLAELQRINGFSEREARLALNEELIALSAHALKNDENPAYLIHEMARTRGFKAKPTSAEAAAPKPEEGEKEMRRRRDAETLGRSLSGAGGKPTTGGVSVQDVLAAETGDEFDKMFERLKRESGG